MKLELPCACCGDMVRVSRARYLDLVRSDTLPVCRRNGCFRLVRFASGGVRAKSRAPLAAVMRTGVASIFGEVDRAEIGGRRATLAKVRLKRGVSGGCDAAGAAGE